MKKILLATTALVLSAGVAAADVTLSGDGRMGLNYESSTWDAQGRTRVHFTLSRQGDHGLTFGGTMRLVMSYSNGTTTSNAVQNGSIWIEANGLRVTMGNIDGSIANTVPIYGGGLGFTGRVGRPATHAGYTEGDAPNGTNAVRGDYSNSGFTLSASIQPMVANTGEIAASYSMSGFGVSAGWVQGGNWSVAGTYATGDIGVGLLVSRNGANTNYRVWGTYDIGAVRVAAVHSRVGTMNTTGIGLRYALGGGAFAHGAIAREGTDTRAQVGATFAF